jgi:outer membrane protein
MAASATARTVVTVATELASVSVDASINSATRRSARPIISTLLASVLAVLVPSSTFAGPILDYIRNYDLNDYSLGVAVSVGQSPYVGTPNSTIVYPYLTSFTHSAFTDDWLLLRDENLGFRYITDSQWEFGVVGRFQGLGANIPIDGELAGVDEKDWTIEAGPLIGYRAWPINLQFRTYWEMPNKHDGLTSELEFSYPINYDRGFFVPAVRLIYRDEDYTDYYFSVSEEESTPDRPVYAAGASTSVLLGFSMGYELAPKWLLKANLGVRFLDSAITESPIVDRDTVWSAGVGLAYNADLFMPRDHDDPRSGYSFEVRLGALSSSISTTVEQRTGDGQPQDTTDLENLLRAADNKTFLQFDTRFRINFFHQVQVGYFALRRESGTTLVDDLTFDGQFYDAGTEIQTDTEFSLLRVAYAYSLMRDGQKELGVKAGLSLARFDIDLGEVGSQEAQHLSVRAPMPTFGALGSLTLGQNWSLGADLNFFVGDFDRYNGYMAYFALDLERKFGEVFRAGVGYNVYALRLTAKDENLGGQLDLRIHGPKAYISFTF